jgi:hypothetical protein
VFGISVSLAICFPKVVSIESGKSRSINRQRAGCRVRGVMLLESHLQNHPGGHSGNAGYAQATSEWSEPSQPADQELH